MIGIGLGISETKPVIEEVQAGRQTNSGLIFYITGNDDEVNQYNGSTEDDLSTFSYASKVKDVSGQALNPRGLFIGNEGTKMYLGEGLNVYQYTLGTAYDISTATYDSVSVDLSVVSSAATGTINNFTMSLNGSKLYNLDATGADMVQEFTLTTPWDLSTLTYVGEFDISGNTSSVDSIAINADGTKFYVTDVGVIYQYSFGSAYAVSGSSYDSKSIDLSLALSTTLFGLGLSYNNDVIFINDSGNDTVHQYDFGTAGDISTITASGNTLATGTEESFMRAIHLLA